MSATSNPGNIFADAQAPQAGERFDELLRHRQLVVERIVSSAAITPTDYVQAQDEWVLLVRGEADLRIAGELRTLMAGDYVFLPADTPHRVERTQEGTLWLAVHLHPEATMPAVPGVHP